MNARAQRLCAWSGVVCLVLFFLGFWVVAGFIPPPSPKLTGEQLSDLFTTDRVRIRIGMIVSIFASALLASWAAAISTQMRKMEGTHSALAFTNLAVGALFVLEFIFSLVIWQSMTYRPRDPQVLLAMNDTAWLLFVCITSTPMLQAAVMGIAVLSDKSATPVFPRWAGYLDFWVAALFVPGTIAVFFQDGPFAWNGLFTWYLPLGVFTVWMVVNTKLTLDAVSRDEAAGAASTEPAPDLASLAAELRQVRADLDRMTATRA
ncbi:MAG TPA: hypothetical protein VL595_04530 [Pseudonocardia sp.]|jgi:hypothetical protein|nr:hypothetical protein [Pseudonocardia sp.]